MSEVRRAGRAAGTVAAALALAVCAAGAAAAADSPTSTPTSTVAPDAAASEPSSTPTPTPPPSSTPPASTTPPPSSPPPPTATSKPTAPPASTSTPRRTTTTPRPAPTGGAWTAPGPTVPTPRRSTDYPSTDLAPGGGYTGLSPDQLAAQVAEADRIWAALTSSNSGLSAALLEMDRLSKEANALLESLSKARDEEQAARSRAAEAQTRMATVLARLDRARQVMREWAFSVYAEGDSTVEMLTVLDAMLANPDTVGDPMGDLSHLTDERLRSVQELRELTREQRLLQTLTADSQRSATEAARRIASDKARLDGLVRTQKATLERLQMLQAAEIDKAGPVAGFLVGASTPEARAAAARLREALGGSGVAVTDVGGAPCSGNDGAYPNGAVPTSALCPLWEAPGHALRPRAAAAFNAMSQAYAKQTGAPLCVTDSYRSLAAQYAVKAAKGRWAATPGTSKHGLGVALDLCGGVNDYGAPAHLWMKQNAPLYGWFHPAWAAAGGSLPEPWHWEFAG